MKVLDDIKLKDYFNFNGLLAKVEELNSMSYGVKQMICLARTLLRKYKIVLLDEAIGNVDSNTDLILQKVIRTYLKNCTILSITHNLLSIGDFDKVK